MLEERNQIFTVGQINIYWMVTLYTEMKLWNNLKKLRIRDFHVLFRESLNNNSPKITRRIYNVTLLLVSEYKTLFLSMIYSMVFDNSGTVFVGRSSFVTTVSQFTHYMLKIPPDDLHCSKNANRSVSLLLNTILYIMVRNVFDSNHKKSSIVYTTCYYWTVINELLTAKWKYRILYEVLSFSENL